jgi:hypothetical protein
VKLAAAPVYVRLRDSTIFLDHFSLRSLMGCQTGRIAEALFTGILALNTGVADADRS